MNPVIHGRIATNNFRPTRRDHGRNLMMIYDATVLVVAKLLGAIGDQDAEIDPSAKPAAILNKGTKPRIAERWP